MDMYHSLQYALYETRCPQTVDWTSSVRPSDPGHGVAIAILSVPRECIGLLLEGISEDMGWGTFLSQTC